MSFYCKLRFKMYWFTVVEHIEFNMILKLWKGGGLSSDTTIFTCRLGLLFWMKGRAYLDICCYIMKYYSEVLKEDQWCYICLSNKILFGLIFKKYFLVSQSNCLYVLVMKYHVIVWGQSVFNFAHVVRFLWNVQVVEIW